MTLDKFSVIQDDTESKEVSLTDLYVYFDLFQVSDGLCVYFYLYVLLLQTSLKPLQTNLHKVTDVMHQTTY